MLLITGAIAAAVVTAWTFGSGPAEAAFPGANGKIACGGLRGSDADLEIFDFNPDGSGERLLTNNGFRDGSPSYSPDGTKIAFESGRDRILGQGDNTEIYVANNDGNLTGPDVKRLTFNRGQLPDGTVNANAATDFSPTWSPDGTEIAFHSGRVATFTDGGTTPVSDFEIYKMSATTGEGGLTAGGAPANPATRLTNNRGQDAIPSWSPDGSKIAFQGFPAGNPATLNNNLEIWTINPDGSGRTNVSNNPGTPNIPTTPVNENANGLDRDVIWSSDSSKLAFNSARATAAGNQNNDVYTMNRDGSGLKRLTTGPDSPAPAAFTDYDVPLVWSPDSSKLLIASSRSTTSAEQTDFFAYTIDPDLGDAAPAQKLIRVEQFQRCDWTKPQPARVITTPPTYQGPGPGATPATFARCLASTANVVRGSAAANIIIGTPAGDRIFAGSGNDKVDARAGADCVDLGAGADTGQGGTCNDLLLGGLGNDRVSGSSGRDTMNGGSGRDVLSGGSSADRLTGSTGNDRLNGGSGNDSLAGSSGNDRLTGAAGADRFSGGSGNDRISARDRKRDRISCGSGRRDRVVADRVDRVARDCERVTRR